MLKMMLIFLLSVLDQKHFFGANLFPKFKVVCVRRKFGTYTNSNMLNSMMMFILEVPLEKLVSNYQGI